MKGLTLIILLVVLAGAGLASSTIKLSYFNVERDGNAFMISWKAEIEQDVRSYELYRKTSYAAMFSIGTSP